MTATATIAIVGAGLMGREIAAAIQRWPALLDHPVRPRLTAICDINPQAFGAFDGIPTIARRVTDYRDLLTDDSIDALYVAVRHDLHERIYTDIIASGKALLAEKPFGIDTPAAGSITAAMDAHPESFVRCSSEMPFFPGAQAAVNYVRSGSLGRIIRARNSFLHSSDLNVGKPLNWKRQARYCGEAGVMNDLGLHAWHVPLRLGWRPSSLYAELENIVMTRPTVDGGIGNCDTWDNATTYSWIPIDGYEFPLVTETKRIAPGHKNSWEFEAIGMDGGVRFSTRNPKRLEIFGVDDIAGVGTEQVWKSVDTGSQSVWPTVTGSIFEFGFSDAILQMLAAFLAERAGALGDRFGTVTPLEAAFTHRIFDAAMSAHRTGHRQPLCQ